MYFNYLTGNTNCRKTWNTDSYNSNTNIEDRNRVTFEIKTCYHFNHITSREMKLLEMTQKRIMKKKGNENILNLEITELVLV